MAFFVAFYSYKGGVGRSLALANVAYSLASRGKRVVLLDLDLEAPGLQELPAFSFKGSGTKKGFLEYAAAYRRTGTCPEISRYLHPCRESPGLGKLWVMPSGALGSTYQEQLGSLSWKRLHPKKGTEPFVEELRSALVREFAPQYVLIDSRTGLSDIGGLTTHRLADMVVLVFNLTRPSIEGSVRAYLSFTAEGSRVQTVQLVASPVPPLVPGAGSIVERRLQKAGELMPIGAAFGRTLIRIEYDPAMVLAEDLAVQNPEAFAAAARYEGLRESIQRANPEEVFPVLEEARTLRSEGRIEEGLSLLRTFAENHPENAEGYLEWGNFLFEAGRAGEAVKAFQQARRLVPDLAMTHRRLGEALVASGRAEEAIDVLERAEILGEKSREFYRALAHAYEIKKETSKEIEARRKGTLAILGTPREPERAPSLSNIQFLKREFIDFLSRRRPYLGIPPDLFWDNVMTSLHMGLASKVQALKQILAGEMTLGDINNLLRNLQEERDRWIEILGPEVLEMQSWIAHAGIDPFDHNAVLALRRGDRSDSVILGFVALDDSELSFTQRASLLEEAIQLSPDNYALQEAGGQLFLDFGAKSEDEDSRLDFLKRAAELFEKVSRSTESETALFGWGLTLHEMAPLSPLDDRAGLLREAASKYQQTLLIDPQDYEALNNLGNVLADLAELAPFDEKHRLLQESASKYKEALAIQPDDYETLYNWGNVLEEIASLNPSDEESILQEAASKYCQAVQVNPHYYEALFNWGTLLSDLSELTPPKERPELLKEAIGKYEQALQIRPDSHECLYNWGVALRDLSGLADLEGKASILQEAAAKFQQALAIKPDKEEALNNWGNTLVDLAELAPWEEKRALLQEAVSKHKQSLQIIPDDQPALHNWGRTLASLAEIAKPEERRSMLQEAASKYRQALQILPSDLETLDGLCGTLLLLARLEEGEPMRLLATRAADLSRQANEFSPGFADYNLACALSYLGQFEEAITPVRMALQRGLETPAYALDDPDLQPLWAARPDFKAEIEEKIRETASNQRS